MKTALICGVSGQDGAWLAKSLLERGDYQVVGTSRDAQVSPLHNLKRLGIASAVRVESMAPNDFRSVFQTLSKIKPDEIYNLSGQSSVGLSFQQPVETLESISAATLNILECIRFLDRPVRFYNAGSSECYGETGREGANETVPFSPRSPYAVAKAAAFWEVANYREAYGIYACSGILFNHESPLRPARFVTRKIVSTAVRIHLGERSRLEMGNLDIWRDWGYAPEYVDAMWRMLQQDQPEDFVIATGTAHSLKDFIRLVFEKLSMDWEEHVSADPELLRPSDITFSRGDPSRARQRLGWEASTGFEDLLEILIESELAWQTQTASRPAFF